MYRSLLALIAIIFIPQAFAAEPNAIVEATGDGLARLEVNIRPKGGKELLRYELKGEKGLVAGGITIPGDGGADYEITAFDAEGRATYSGKGSVPSFREGDRPLPLPLPSTEGGDGLVVSLSRERLVLNATESGEPNNFTVEVQALDPRGNPLKIEPGDIYWDISDPRHFEIHGRLDGFKIDLHPKKDFPIPFKFCDVPPVVLACLPNTNCKAIKVCPDPFVMVSAGGTHSCALTKSGAAMCWGLNNQGQLGYPTVNSCNSSVGVTSICSTRPQRVVCPAGAPCRFTHISVGETLTVAIDTNGNAWWWGRGAPDHHQVVATLAGSPVSFWTGAAGFGHGCAISTSRSEVWCWGTNAYGEAGAPLPMVEVPYTAPVRVLVPAKFKKVVAGGEHTCAIGSAGYDIVCWGRDDENQTRGPNFSQVGQFFFQLFGGLTSILDVATSSNSTCVTLGFNNGVRCWGANALRNVAPFGMPEHVTVGFGHICATSNQLASCVGTNNWGELGNGSMMQQAAPGPVKAPPPLYANITAGNSHTCGLTPDGDIFCWGGNVWGQAGTGAATYSVKDPTKVLMP